MNQYGMEDRMVVANLASYDITKYFNDLNHTVSFIDVEKEKFYQDQDIDKIWVYHHGEETMMKLIEIKGDTYDKSGNFFIETVSNVELNKPGCFLYSKAHYFNYYFVNTKEMNFIPLQKARKWFLEHQSEFREVELSTRVGEDGKFYTSRGRLVPKDVMYKAIPEIKVKSIKDFLKRKNCYYFIEDDKVKRMVY